MSEVLRIHEAIRKWEDSLREAGHEIPKAEQKAPIGDPQIMGLAHNKVEMPSDSELSATIARLQGRTEKK